MEQAIKCIQGLRALHGDKAVEKVMQIMKHELADLTTKISDRPLSRKQLVDARLVFRYTPPAAWLEELTTKIIIDRLRDSVHDYQAWMFQQTSATLSTNVLRFLLAFEISTTRCVVAESVGMFSCPSLGILIHINPVFGCQFCGASKIDAKDKRFCSACETWQWCKGCEGCHLVPCCCYSPRNCSVYRRRCASLHKRCATRRYRTCPTAPSALAAASMMRRICKSVRDARALATARPTANDATGLFIA